MIKRYIQLFPVLLMFAACGSTPPVPTDSYYRLTLPPLGVEKQRITDEVIHVGSFTGEGLYNERAVLYTGDEHGRRIVQHHYHFWLTTPPRMLREHMVEFLRAADSAPMIITDSSRGDGLRISGKVLDFEKQTAGDVITANVGLELRVDTAGEDLPRFIKQYRLKEPVSGTLMTDTIESFNAAVLKIYREFVADIHALVQ
jgi:ABC-type uncharacterized transport system auxiliary subunit